PWKARSELAKASCAITECNSLGILGSFPIPSWPTIFCTLGSLGSEVPRCRGPGPAWRAERWHPTRPYRAAERERVQERTDCLVPLPRQAPARQVWAPASAAGPALGSNRTTRLSRRLPRKEQDWVLGS